MPSHIAQITDSGHDNLAVLGGWEVTPMSRQQGVEFVVWLDAATQTVQVCVENKHPYLGHLFSFERPATHRYAEMFLDSAFPTACLMSDIVHPVQWPKWHERGVLFSRGVSQLPPALPNSAWSLGKLMYLWAFASHSSESRRLITKYFKFYPLYIYPDFLYITISKRGTGGVLYFGIQVTLHVLTDMAKLKELFA